MTSNAPEILHALVSTTQYSIAVLSALAVLLAVDPRKHSRVVMRLVFRRIWTTIYRSPFLALPETIIRGVLTLRRS